MMSEINPRHSIKARRKQKEETIDLPNVETGHADDKVDGKESDDNNNRSDLVIDAAWRSKYEAAVRKRRSPVATAVGAANAGSHGWGNNNTTNMRMTNLSPLSSAVNSITSMSQADMEFILAPSIDDNTYDIDHQMHTEMPSINEQRQQQNIIDDSVSPTSNYSADSIIRRVEAEIAAARKSAAMAKHNQYYNHSNNNNSNHHQNGQPQSRNHVDSNVINEDDDDDDDDDDMAQILNTTNTFSDHNQGGMNGTASPSIASDDSSKRRAMDLIHDEFLSANTDIDSPSTCVEQNRTTVDFLPGQSITTDANNNNSNLWYNARPSTAANSFLMNLRQTTKDMVKTEETNQYPFEEKKEDGNSTVTKDTPFPDFGTPTRSNARRVVKDPEATLDVAGINNTIEPDGKYQETTTPPRPHLQQISDATTDEQKKQIMPETNTSTPTAAIPFFKPFPPLSSPPPPPPPPAAAASQQQRRSSPMDKTRELLDSLKEQRQSLQKSPSTNNNKNMHRETVDMIPSERSNTAFAPPSAPSPSGRNQQRPIFPEEVYDLVKESSEKTAADATAGTGVAVSSTDQSRRIRFRNPFPILKPPTVHRSLDEMILEHAMDIPDIPVRWVKPKQELKQLIVAAMGTSLPRRSNACGALKVLTRQEKNQLSLVRTDGFLQAITYAASQSVLDVDTDLAIDARTRAVTCFKNVCHPKDNRIIILNHPGVIECLLKVVQNDDGAGRATAAAAIALLAKTPQCRECLVHIEGLIDTLAKVMHSASTMISAEAMVVRNSSPRSGSNQSYTQQQVNKSLSNIKDENSIPVDSLVNHQTGIIHDKAINRNDPDPLVTESSSLSSGEGAGNNPSSPDSPSKTTNSDVIALMGSKLYDVRSVDSIRNQTEERYDEFVNQARCNACAALLHISKQCATSHDLATNQIFVSCVAAVAREVDHPIHTKCLEILCNLTRLPMNNTIMTRFDGMIETLIMASNSTNPINRLAALHSLQNMSSDSGSKTILATSAVLNLLTSCAMRKDTEEKDIAVATLYNITTEPGAVTAITNTKNVVATLVHLAHSPDSSSEVRLLACEALATISLWLQTLAGTGKVPDNVVNVPLPSQKTTGWERWD